MCGIVGYVGSKDSAPILVEGLRRLEYRGYDSAGLAVHTGRGVEIVRAVGRPNKEGKCQLSSGMLVASF